VETIPRNVRRVERNFILFDVYIVIIVNEYYFTSKIHEMC